MSKTLHYFIIVILIINVVLLALVASKSESFSGGAVPPSDKAGNLSAHLRGMGSILGSLPARLRAASGSIGVGAAALPAQIKMDTLENFRGVGIPGGLSARLREAANDTMGSAAVESFAKITGHDNGALKMSIVPDASKMTIMSNLMRQ